MGRATISAEEKRCRPVLFIQVSIFILVDYPIDKDRPLASVVLIQGFPVARAILGNPAALGVNLDTGNSWLGGADPVEMARVFKDKIHHIHWKDLGEEWVAKRGSLFGCGFSTIALGDGVIDIKGVCEVLKDADIASSTLEIVGTEEILLKSVDYLRGCGV